MTHDADRSDEERPSDADSGVRLAKNTGPGREETATIADPNTPDHGESGRLPNWDDREKDERAGWEKAKIPKEEWLRAKEANDASLARETPGSPDFSRLMEARIHLHLGPAPEIDFGEISAYKRSVYQDALAEDLRREIAEKEPEAGGLTTRRMMVAAGILVVVVVILFLIILQGPSQTASTQPTAAPTQTTQATATPKPLELAPTQAPQPISTATVAPVAIDTSEAVTTTTPAVTAKTTKPTATAKATVTTAPTATGEVPFFKPMQK